MAEFPYFPFYPRDWLTGQATALMTAEQKGAFIDLLGHAWLAEPPCTLPDAATALAKLSGLGAKWKRAGADIRAQFDACTDHPGRIRNAKQWAIYEDMLDHRARRANAGKKGNAARWGESPEDRIGIALGSQDDRNGVAKSSPSLALALPPALSPAEEQQQVALYGQRLTVRANQGLIEHPTAPQPIPRVMAGAGSTHEAALAILGAGISLDFAEAAVYSLAKAHTADDPIVSLKYFTGGVLRAWKRHQAGQAVRAADRPPPMPAAGDPVIAELERWQRETDAKESKEKSA